MGIPRIRTIGECKEEILKLDENSSICEWYIRQLCENNLVKHFKSGKKVLVNFDDLLRYLNGYENCEVPACM